MADPKQPHTPKQAALHGENGEPPLSGLDTPGSSPTSRAATPIFSPNTSISSDGTDYDSTPTRRNEEDDHIGLPALGVLSLPVDDTADTAGNVPEQDPKSPTRLSAPTKVNSTACRQSDTSISPETPTLAGPNESPATIKAVKEEDDPIPKLNLLETYKQSVKASRGGAATSSNLGSSRRSSFSLAVDFRFGGDKGRPEARVRPRPRSDIGVSPKFTGSATFDQTTADSLEVKYSSEIRTVLEKSIPAPGPLPPQTFQPHPDALSKMTIQQRLQKLLTRPLARKDSTETGLIYVFWYPGAFGHVKIGYTKDIGKRMASWERQCGRKPDKYFPSEKADVEPVPHRLRVEQLVHAELAQYRRQEPKCETCGGKHIEWFEVDVAFAISIVQKWVKWMRERPYEPVEATGTNGEISWLLSKKHMNKIAELSEPTRLPTRATPTRKVRRSVTPGKKAHSR
ncbi:T5orf172 domain-containing protein [Aspergillus aurantiobrunneus]